MDSFAFSPLQEQLIHEPITGSLSVTGPPGSGKTTAAAFRLRRMIEQGIPAESILILTPQRSLAASYHQQIARADLPAGSLPTIVTPGGLAQRTLQLFWPAIATDAGFKHPEQPPVFLTLETAQYYMAKVVQPLLVKGYFEQLVIDRNRLFSQLLDDLNKAAVTGFSYHEIGARLTGAWVGKPEQLIHYQQAQEAVNLFRAYCLEHNLLDYSLQIEIFSQQLWPSLLIRQYLASRYRHLIYDNIEEDVPVAHDLVREWLPAFESALLISDQNGGYRAFLGADPASAELLLESCARSLHFTGSLVTTPLLKSFAETITKSIQSQPAEAVEPQVRSVFTPINVRFFPEMIDTVAAETARLVHEEGVAPGQIAIVAPFLSDSLRHAMTRRLEGYGVTVHAYRPSRSLRAEPAVPCLLTLARLAHPAWNLPPTVHDVRAMLLQAIAGLDLVRADLMAAILFDKKNKEAPLRSFDPIKGEMQQRITFSVGERYMRLYNWLNEYLHSEPVELDIFLARIFGEILSQPGFGFHGNFAAAGATARLIESVQKFRRVAEPTLIPAKIPVGQEYIQMVMDGVIAAQYLLPENEGDEDVVYLAPAYSFLVNNRTAQYQFWLDVGSLGWWERLYQPLTHPHVLSRRWEPGRPWTDADEFRANQETLSRLVSGLIARCERHVYLCAVRVNERGSEEKGPLLQALQSFLRRSRSLEDAHV